MKSRIAITAAALALIGGSTAAVAQNEATPAVAQYEATPAPVSLEGLAAEGASVYRSRCARCHGRNGDGQRQGHDAAPRLAGNFARLSVGKIAVQVIQGGRIVVGSNGAGAIKTQKTEVAA